MNYRIETKESFQVFGIEGVFQLETMNLLILQRNCVSSATPTVIFAGDLPSFVDKNLYKVNTKRRHLPRRLMSSFSNTPVAQLSSNWH
ncbi:hypothetical protein [Paenibacillus sp. GCM10012306]|uniref:hypothetical protein n=1 Tax=Paenibacillus sp. GCM10012306 TaxID=3317342 RepID=UPI00362153D2